MRDYQRAAINKVLWRNEGGQLAAHSGVLVLVCKILFSSFLYLSIYSFLYLFVTFCIYLYSVCLLPLVLSHLPTLSLAVVVRH